MCGILGVVSIDRVVDDQTFHSALTRLAHRGPDGEGIWRRPTGAGPVVTLGHRRLAIIDLSDAAAQPMAAADSSAWMTYNGEVYNYLELRSELAAKGHRFRTSSDSEVLLAAYRQWGENCVERLNGMFAFAIWDERRQHLFAARDRFGEKPFHYVWDERLGFFAFASEIKALLALPLVDASIDDRALYRFVAFAEQAGSDQTMWRSVKRLPPAHTLRLSWNGQRLRQTCFRYWDIDLSRTETLDTGRAADRFGELFADSVRLRLQSDVPVGTSLSGGLDSSTVVCQIHALGAAAGQTSFSARMTDPALDEGCHIDAVIAATGIPNRQVWPSAEELVRVFSRLCYHQEEPFPATSQFAQFLVMGLARESKVTVLLDGQGADELLAGYTPDFHIRYADLADRWQLGALWREHRAFRARHPGKFPLSRRALAARLFPRAYGALNRFRDSPAGTDAWQASDARVWWSREWAEAFAAERPALSPASNRDPLTRRLYTETLQGELQELLRYGDRNSMAWSRELRQPFLDHRIAEFVFALPPEQKLVNGETKVLLRRAARQLVPDSVLRRQDKLGYQAPLARWLKGPLATWAEQGLETSAQQLGPRLVPDVVDVFRRTVPSLQERTAWTPFALLTLGESRRQLGNALMPDPFGIVAST